MVHGQCLVYLVRLELLGCSSKAVCFGVLCAGVWVLLSLGRLALSYVSTR